MSFSSLFFWMQCVSFFRLRYLLLIIWKQEDYSLVRAYCLSHCLFLYWMKCLGAVSLWLPSDWETVISSEYLFHFSFFLLSSRISIRTNVGLLILILKHTNAIPFYIPFRKIPFRIFLPFWLMFATPGMWNVPQRVMCWEKSHYLALLSTVGTFKVGCRGKSVGLCLGRTSEAPTLPFPLLCRWDVQLCSITCSCHDVLSWHRLGCTSDSRLMTEKSKTKSRCIYPFEKLAFCYKMENWLT